MTGLSGYTTKSVARDVSSYLSAADQQNVSAALAAVAWNTTNITISFPTASLFFAKLECFRNGLPGGEFQLSPLQKIVGVDALVIGRQRI